MRKFIENINLTTAIPAATHGQLYLANEGRRLATFY
jgi:hypothetical protein